MLLIAMSYQKHRDVPDRVPPGPAAELHLFYHISSPLLLRADESLVVYTVVPCSERQISCAASNGGHLCLVKKKTRTHAEEERVNL